MNDLTISPSGTRFVATREAVILHAYPDATGTWTLGAGHTAAAGPPVPVAGMTISSDAAYALLATDFKRVYEPKLHSLVKVDLAQHEFDALDSFIYNVGGGNLAGSTLLRLLNVGDRQGAADAFMSWTRSKGVELDGLKKRRAAERANFLTGQYPDDLPEPGHTGQAMAQAHTLSKGMMGADVVTLQKQLGVAGYPVKADGAFGTGTDAAVRVFQSSRGLPVDGVVGLKTWLALDKAQDAAVAHVDLPAPKPLALPPIKPGPDPTIKMPAAKTGFWHVLVAAFTPKTEV